MTSRAAAFDPARLDDLDALLPPPALAKPPRPTSAATDAESTSSARATRGPGGRPSASKSALLSGLRSVAVRVPRPLYEKLVRDVLGSCIERPSYAQIVSWTCEDHPDEVAAELTDQKAATSRVPRGRKLAADAVAITLRFLPSELQRLDDVIDQAAADDERPTRTAAVAAALRVAVAAGRPLTTH